MTGYKWKDWTEVDWTQRDVDIAEDLGVSREAVRVARKREGQPKSPLYKVSRIRIQLMKIFESNKPITIKEAKRLIKGVVKVSVKSDTLRSTLKEINSYTYTNPNGIPVLITHDEVRKLWDLSGLTLSEFAGVTRIDKMYMTFLLYEKKPKKKIHLSAQKKLVAFRKEMINIMTKS